MLKHLGLVVSQDSKSARILPSLPSFPELILATSAGLQQTSKATAFFLLDRSHRDRDPGCDFASLPTGCASHKGSPQQVDLAILSFLSTLLRLTVFLFPPLGSVWPLGSSWKATSLGFVWSPQPAACWNISLLAADPFL